MIEATAATSHSSWLRYWLYDWGGWNADLLLRVNSSLPHEWVPVAEWLSLLGSYWGAPVLLIGLWAWRRAHPTHDVAQVAPFRFVAGLLPALTMAGITKAALAFPRPAVAIPYLSITIIGEPDSLYSLPSGHATYMGVVTASLWPLLQWHWRLLLIAAALAVGWSRVALGAHFPADVVAGLALGWVCVAATGRFSRLMSHAWERTKESPA